MPYKTTEARREYQRKYNEEHKEEIQKNKERKLTNFKMRSLPSFKALKVRRLRSQNKNP